MKHQERLINEMDKVKKQIGLKLPELFAAEPTEKNCRFHALLNEKSRLFGADFQADVLGMSAEKITKRIRKYYQFFNQNTSS